MAASTFEETARASLLGEWLFRSRQRARRASVSSFVFGLVALLPCVALSEGAVRLLDCTVVTICDGSGNCEEASDQVTFRMEPVVFEASGSSRYPLSYRDTQAEMSAMSDTGPFFWTIHEERAALLASSETEWLWHRLTLGPVPEATISFLVCSFQQ